MLFPHRKSLVKELAECHDINERTNTMLMWIHEQPYNVRTYFIDNWASPDMVQEATASMIPHEFIRNINWAEIFAAGTPAYTLH